VLETVLEAVIADDTFQSNLARPELGAAVIAADQLDARREAGNTVRRHVEVDTGVVDIVPECSTDDIYRAMRRHVEVDTGVVDIVPECHTDDVHRATSR